MTRLSCPCGEVFHVGGAPAGSTIRCRRCGRILQVSDGARTGPSPGPSAAPTSSAATPAEPADGKGRKRRRLRFSSTAIVMPEARGEPRTGSMSDASRRGPPRPPQAWRASRIPRLLVWAAAGMTLLLALVLRFDADGSPFGMLLAFAPRAWILAPWVLLLPASLFLGVATVGVAVLGAGMAFFMVAGFEVPSWPAPAVANRALRIVTYNTDRSAEVALRLRQDMALWGADVVLLQDCKTVTADSLRAIAPTGLHVSPQFCLASRYPLQRVDTLKTTVRTGTATVGRYGNVLRYDIAFPWGVLPVYNVHLESPRTALGAARQRMDLSHLTTSLVVRASDSQRASRFIRRSDSAYVVAGDFNLPFESVILRRDWGDLTNAFAAVGWGFGYTMRAGFYRVRIDHVLTPPTLVPVAAQVLSGYPSEHQPVVVDLAWRASLR